MKKLLTMFKNLPPEVRMMVAMAGLGTPMGAIYLLKRILFPTTPLIYIILGIAAVLGLLALVGWLISKGFTRGKRKRSKKMGADLAESGAAGPVAMDVRATIKSNNEKFFSATRRMRKEFGVDVYDLPWYITIGDSGCGKTKLINEGGLTFSAGKPEGYQLGTLNYNFWFTEDAVFIDMAGRLCNPQDDGDHREWQAFLDTVSKGRRGFPINGALVCISAEHLLQDSPEKHEEDANTALERLRELQSKLGVTFATYLIITKCDKILGFMQLFDRAERDITVKNQIFGWSKPGNFDELYDPEKFGGDFDELYGRLNELRLRRLNDEIDGQELGSAYTFPEEFREIRAPLQTYIRTLFPFVKNPKAMKNLVFRGVYCTSATQQGSVILKHLAERLGEEAAAHFAPLESMYPRPRPYFIKDVLFRKVFLEQGLVFRNEQQVRRNRKLAKWLTWGSAAMFVVLISLLTWSFMTFEELMGEPRKHVAAARDDWAEAPRSLDTAELLETDIQDLDGSWAAWFLSMGRGADGPIEDLTTVQAGLFEKGVLGRAISELQRGLRSTELAESERRSGDQGLRQSFESTLGNYLAWLGCATKSKEAPEVFTEDNKAHVHEVVKEDRAIIRRDGFFAFTKRYFDAVAEGKLGEDRMPTSPQAPDAFPASDDEREKAEQVARQTVVQAVEHLRQYFMRRATVDENHPDPTIREWMRILDQCRTVEQAYAAILDLDYTQIRSLADLDEYKNDYDRNLKRLNKALKACQWQVERVVDEGPTRIKPLHEAILSQRAEWDQSIKNLLEAYGKCEAPEAESEAILALIREVQEVGPGARDKSGLDQVLWGSLRDQTLIRGEIGYSRENLEKIGEFMTAVEKLYSHLLVLKPGGPTSSDRIALAAGAERVLDALNEAYAKVDVDWIGNDETMPPRDWDERIDQLARSQSEPEADGQFADLVESWRSADLGRFLTGNTALARRGRLTSALTALDRQLSDIGDGDWGLATMWSPDAYLDRIRSHHLIRIKAPEKETPGEREGRRKERPGRRPRERERIMPGRKSRRIESQEADRRKVVQQRRAQKEVPRCATRGFINESLGDAYNLRLLLVEHIRSEDFLASTDGDLPRLCADGLLRACRVYLEKYFIEWLAAYRAERLEIEGIAQSENWPAFRRALDRSGIDTVLESLAGEVLQHVAWAEYDFEDDSLREFRDLIAVARDKSWGEFEFQNRIVGRESGDDRTYPWDSVAQVLAGSWNDFRRQVKDLRSFAGSFRDPDGLVPLAAIKWDPLEARYAEPLQDMLTVMDLQTVFRTGQILLGRELQNILLRRRKQLKMDHPDLPFMPRDRQRLGAVDPEGFLRFLQEMKHAQTYFKILDVELPGSKERRSFYEGCEQWRKLIGEDEREAWTKPLEVKITLGLDVGGEGAGYPWTDAAKLDYKQARAPTTGVANFHEEVQLCLGLSGSESITECIVLYTQRDIRSAECQWRWPGSNEGDVLFFRVCGEGGKESVWQDAKIQPFKSAPVCEPGKLSLLALLNACSKASPDRKVWRFGIAWDLAAMAQAEAIRDRTYHETVSAMQTRGGETYVGTMCEFSFDRRIPEPIPGLKQLRPR